ncbi:hypothetical protein DENSPDRAFT_876807 [Dentipellis sp. KUC8613]|nr:hypothetical protein DENSPDRAFT_876807 [Dentipellis sp. KUC8613]
MLTILTLILHELDIFIGFSWRDWSASIIPGALWASGAFRNLSLMEAVYNSLFLVSWLTLFVYLFTLSNQITGVEEDRINKPDRPIPSGKITIAGAQVRWLIVFSSFVGTAAFQPSLLPANICWIATIASMVLTPGGGNWFWKNTISMTAGTWALLQASWLIVAPMTPRIETYSFAVALWLGLNMQIQDLRDIKGDCSIGRTTLPVVVGDRASRVIICFVFMPMAIYVLHISGILELAPVTLGVLHIALAYRVLRMGGPRYDHKTYMFFTYIFCAVVALAGNEGLSAGPARTEIDGLAASRGTNAKLQPSLVQPISG